MSKYKVSSAKGYMSDETKKNIVEFDYPGWVVYGEVGPSGDLSVNVYNEHGECCVANFAAGSWVSGCVDD